jgi:hypothetical protein
LFEYNLIIDWSNGLIEWIERIEWIEWIDDIVLCVHSFSW